MAGFLVARWERGCIEPTTAPPGHPISSGGPTDHGGAGAANGYWKSTLQVERPHGRGRTARTQGRATADAPATSNSGCDLSGSGRANHARPADACSHAVATAAKDPSLRSRIRQIWDCCPANTGPMRRRRSDNFAHPLQLPLRRNVRVHPPPLRGRFGRTRFAPPRRLFRIGEHRHRVDRASHHPGGCGNHHGDSSANSRRDGHPV